MDRNNGGDPLAPPRPPKLLPRVHRPRAPEPTMMSESTTIAAAVASETPQCTNTNSNNNNNSSRHIISNSNSNSNSNSQQQHFNSITNLNNSSSNNNNVAALNTQNALQQQQQQLHSHHQQHHHHHQHHLTTPLLQLHPSHQRTTSTTTTNLSRNNSNLSNISFASTSVTAANSFTRRRPLPPTPAAATVGIGNANVLATTATTATPSSTAAAAVPLLTVVNGNILSGSFLHSNDPPARPVSPPVTLAAPRPESERLTNEYVDTPFRTAQQLQHASRTQHPAGQAVRGQTTTQHSLLRQQSQNRQQQHQQQQQQQQHSSRVGTAGSATTTATPTATSTTPAATVDRGSDQLDAFLHSNSSHKTTPATTTTTAGKTPTVSSSTPPPPPARPHATTALFNNTALPITQPITKQPASANNNASNTFTKDQQHHQQHPAFNDDILDLHHIGGLSTPPGAPGSNSNTLTHGSTATPIMIGAGSDVAALNPITCPRCERCRCEQCQSPRQLPQTWVCNKTCLCSAETIIDYASCLCCVKALFYHCAKDHEELDCDDGATTLCVDDPCSCLPHKRTQRWGWLGALSLVLPCLWCYWPMRGCMVICEKCYGRFAGHGCRCQQIGSTSSMLPIVPLGIGSGSNNGGGLNGGSGGNALNGSGNNVVSGTKSVSGGGGHQHHQRHHSECSAAQRILRKCDLTPEKRLLDSSPEY